MFILVFLIPFILSGPLELKAGATAPYLYLWQFHNL